MTRNIATLVYWIRERESIRLRRLAGAPPPWTSDPILQIYKFCNIRRRDDRVSQWVLNHVIALPTPEGSLGLLYMGMFLALCRWNNWPPTIQEILDTKLWPTVYPQWHEMGKLIDARRARKEKAWTGSYICRAERAIDGHDFGDWGKGAYVTRIVIQREMNLAAQDLRVALRTNTRQAVATVLQRCYGWGSFMAGQVVDDWSWTPLLKDATDHYTWAPQGPGSIRGLNRLNGLLLTHRWKDDDYLAELRELRSEVLEELGPKYADLSLHNLSNCLCEVDKFLRVKNGEGRPRSLYRPETAY